MNPKNFSVSDLKSKLSGQMFRNRDQGVREKVQLFYLAIHLKSVSMACKQRNVSRDFFYRWWKRLWQNKFKIESLREISRRPHSSPSKILDTIETRILELRNHFNEGAEMIFYRLKRENLIVSESTIQHVLRRREREVEAKAPKLKTHRRRYELPVPGQRIQIDVKHAGKLNTGQKIYVFNAIDECTRYRYAKAFLNGWSETTVEFLKELVRRLPFPIQCIQSDNGTEMTNRLVVKMINGTPRTLHPVERWSQENQIRHRLIPPGIKELNGKIERSHRLDEDYFYYRAERSTIDAFNQGLGRWITEYNEERPHGGLKGLTPHEKWIERLKHLPSEIVEDRWKMAKTKFLRNLPLHQNPLEQLMQDLKTQILLYNHYIRGT